LLVELLRELRVGRGVDVGLDALPDLRGELVRAGEREAGARGGEAAAVGRERLLEGGGSGDGQRRRPAGAAPARAGAAPGVIATPAAGGQGERRGGEHAREGARAPAHAGPRSTMTDVAFTAAVARTPSA